jgi:hypothetical protein
VTTTSKRKDSLKETSVEELLDALVDAKPEATPRPVEDPWGEEYQSKLMKKEALKTIRRYRREEPLKLDKPDKNPPVKSDKTQKLRNCQSCYYCSATKQIGGSWWCRCSNPGRSGQDEPPRHGWVKGKLGLPCWRER